MANLYVEGADPDERLSGVPDTAKGVRLTLPSAVCTDRLRDGEGSADGGDEEDEPGRVAFAEWPVGEELEKPIESESEVEAALVETLRARGGLAVVLGSAQNVDRLVTVYRAALQADRTLVVDPYTADVARASAR